MYSSSLQGVSDSYYTNQRLDYINKSIHDLIPEVKLLDPGRIDFEPLRKEINNLTKTAYGMKRDIEFYEEGSAKMKTRAEENLKGANKLEQSASKEVRLVNAIIGEIQALASNTDVEGGPKIDNALKRAQDLLVEMKQVSFQADRDKATDQLENANVLYSEMTSYEKPVKDLTQDKEKLNDRIDELANQIEDMYNLTRQVDHLASEVEQLNFQNKKVVDPASIGSMKSGFEQTKEDLAKADELNKISQGLVKDAQSNFSRLSMLSFIFYVISIHLS